MMLKIKSNMSTGGLHITVEDNEGNGISVVTRAMLNADELATNLRALADAVEERFA